MKERVRAVLSERWPVAVRLLVMLPGVVAALLPLHTTAATVWATLAAAAGLIVGDTLGRATVRPAWSASVFVGLTLLGWTFGWALTQTAMAQLFSPSWSLGVGTAVALAGTTFGVVGGLRLAGVRSEAGRAIEVVALVAALVAVFAAHRDGVVVRPLWLSDWAWRNGFEPRGVLVAVGAMTAMGLAGVLIAETRRRPNLPTVLSLALLAVLAWATVDVQNLKVESLARELGLTLTTDGDREQTDEGLEDDGDGDGAEGNAGGEQADGDGGGGGGQPDEGGGGGQGDQQGEGGGEQQDGEGGGGGPPPPMAVVVLGDDVTPSAGSWYLRQETWTRYNGRRLVQPTPGSLDRDIAEFFPVARTDVEPPPQTPLRQRVHGSVSMLAEHTRPFALEGAVTFRPAINPDANRFRRVYLFESDVFVGEYSKLFGKRLENPAWTPTQRNAYLAAPDDPRYRALADEILADLPEEARQDPWAQVVAIKLWMERTIIYSLQHQHARESDPAAAFLFGDRIGYCVHIAHSAVYLFRTLGIPARIATGYLVPEEQRRGSNLIVMSSDGHAWPELYVEDVGWIVFDIHPEQVQGDLPPPLDDDLADLLAELARMQPLEPGEDPEAAAQQAEGRQIPWRQIVLDLLRAVFWLGLAGLYGFKLWRRVALRFAGPHAVPVAGYRLLGDLLAEAGHVRPEGRTREAWGAMMAGVSPTVQQAAWRLAYARFAPQRGEVPAFSIDDQLPVAATDRAAWEALIATLRADLARQVPWWRRVLGALDPTVPFRVR